LTTRRGCAESYDFSSEVAFDKENKDMDNVRFSIVLILATAGTCLAQGMPAPSQGGSIAIRTEAVWPGFDSQVVEEIPYSADALIERTQTLADGNHIVTKQIVALARDSKGRTRREETLRLPGPSTEDGGSERVVYLDDPVAQTTYLLTSSDRVAHKSVRPQTSAAATGTAAPAGGRGPGVPFQSPGGPIAKPGESSESKPEQLGTRTLEGRKLDGVRTKTTIPAGQVGNDRPIEITEERWYSSELKQVVLAKRMDSRDGETVFRLINIQQTEPQASLFEVPTDYRIEVGRQ